MKKIHILFAIILLCAFKADKPAYFLYTPQGKTTSYESLLKEAAKADVVLFGELHNNPICHWLQLELTRDLYQEKKGQLVLGAEMFESDDQLVLNEYLTGKMSDNSFKEETKLWKNYATDYKPLVKFAQEKQLRFIATNIPRRYANLVYSRGTEALDSIDGAAKQFIAPLPMAYDANLKCYKDIAAAAEGHGGENLPRSQAIKDATMSHFIVKNLPNGYSFIHFNGTYHSDNFEGIAWYLKQANPKIKILTISAIESDTPEKFSKEMEGKGDYILVIPSSMTKTY